MSNKANVIGIESKLKIGVLDTGFNLINNKVDDILYLSMISTSLYAGYTDMPTENMIMLFGAQVGLNIANEVQVELRLNDPKLGHYAFAAGVGVGIVKTTLFYGLFYSSGILIR